ncbi:TetR/AcrR family transcriptional regulator [Pararhizobium haloflavum]|uniref:TetR/AcrR family transcriptional regulator n=1 Tax=Pararhizobium haloflavum TaxID=2037914 RepID=UPI000C186380|nr:TetR/AcrR family transcriptional regulator [Pararhizobium haloflavum]
MARGSETRERILEIAEQAVLAKGFGATSIEEVIAAAGITKSGFFYHFKDKNELAKAMLVRYIAENDRIFDDLFGRADELSDDPLQSFLIGLKLLAEAMADLPNGHPGCLIATYCYQERLFDREIRAIYQTAVMRWNDRFRSALARIDASYAPRDAIELDRVGAMLSCVVDGGIIMSKALDDPRILEQQIMAFRSYIKLLFTPPLVAYEREPA